MSTFLTCPQGHRWEGLSSTPCPVCGAAASPCVGNARTEALTSVPQALRPGPSETTTLSPSRPEDDPREASARTGPAGAATLGPDAAPSQEPIPIENLSVPGYRILEEIGRGGMGVVYKAVQVELNRPVALKMILAGAHAGPQELARFNREAEAVARLKHPNIVQIYDVGEHEGCAFLALEYVGGGTLAQHLQSQALSTVQAATLIESLARAVEYAHQHGVVHRDLKPANILLTASDLQGKPANPQPAELVPRIADFGLAKNLDTDQGPTQSGTLIGTPSYMSPEQAAGKSAAVGPAADIYALGAILYELLTGRPPFVGETPLDTVLLLVSQEPVAPRTLVRKCPRDLETICLRCLEKEPKKRYDTAREVADDLERFLRGLPIRARRVSKGERVVRWVRRRPLTAVLLILLVIALGWIGSVYGLDLYRLATNQGRVTLDSPEDGVRVRIQPEAGPEMIVALDGHDLTLPAGNYTLALTGDVGWLELSNDRLTVTRNGRHVVQIRPQPEGEIRKLEGHTGPVHGLAVSPDGQLLLSVSGFPEGDATVRLWDLRTGKELRQFTANKSQVLCVAFSPDGKRALTGGNDNLAHLWDVATGQELQQFRGHRSELSSVAFSRDGQRVLTSSHDGTVRLWDAATGKQLDLFDEHNGMVTWAAFTPDGRQSVSSSHGDNTIRVWDLASGVEVRRFFARDQGIECVAVSPDGRLAAAPGFDRSIRLWDLKTGRLFRRLLGHTNVVSTVAFSPNGRLLVSGSMDGTVRLWDVAGGNEVHAFLGHGDGIRAVTFTPDGRRVVSAGGGRFEKNWVTGADFSIRVWGLPHSPAGSGEPSMVAAEVRRYEGHDKGVLIARVSPDGKWLASAGEDGTVRLWDLESGVERGHLVGHTLPVYGVAWSGDGRRLLTGGRDGSMRLWDAYSGKQLTLCQGDRAWIWDVAFLPDGRHALSGSANGWLRLWDLATGQELHRVRHDGLVRRIAVSADGRSALTCGGESKRVYLWELSGIRERAIEWHGQLGALLTARLSPLGAAAVVSLKRPSLETLKSVRSFEGHTAGIQGVAFSPDGRLALSGGHDRSVRLWDVASGQELKRLDRHTHTVEWVTFSANGKLALSTDWSGVVVCWNVESGQEVGFCGAHERIVTSAAFVSWGRFVTTSHFDPTIRLWQLPEPGKPAPESLQLAAKASPAKAPGEVLRLTGHRNPILAVAVTPDGRHILTGSGSKYHDGRFSSGAENELRLWDARTGREIWRRQGHSDGIFHIAVSPDGQRVLSTDGDKQVRIWSMPDGQLLRTLDGHKQGVRAAVWSADGVRIFTGSNDGIVRAFDAGSGKLLKSFPALDGWIWSMALSPDGRHLAVGAGKTLQLGDPRLAQWGRVIPGHTAAVRAVCFTADGTRLISGGEDSTIQQWDMTTNRARGVLTQASGITCLALAHDGRLAVTGSLDGRIRVWDLKEGRKLCTLAGHLPFAHTVAFFPDGKQIVSGGYDKLARVWSVAEGKALAEKPGRGPGQVTIVTAHPTVELAVKKDGKLLLPRTAKRHLELPPGHYEFTVVGPAEDLRLSPRWLHLAAGETQVVEVRRVRVLPQGPELVRRFEGHGGPVRRLAVSADGRVALSGSGWAGDRTARLWEVATGKEMRRLVGHLGQVFGVALSPDGRYALTGGEDRSARLWDVHTGKEVRCFLGHLGAVWYVAFDPKGERALTAGADRTVRVWDVATGKELHCLEGHPEAVEAAVFSPDGKRILSASMDRSLCLWDAATGRQVKNFAGHGGWGYEVAFSPDGRHVLASDADGSLNLRDATTLEVVRVFRGHQAVATGVAFSADGSRILSGSLDGTVRLWEVATGKELCCLRGHGDGVIGVALTRDGRYALSGGGIRLVNSSRAVGDDFDIRLWLLPK